MPYASRPGKRRRVVAATPEGSSYLTQTRRTTMRAQVKERVAKVIAELDPQSRQILEEVQGATGADVAPEDLPVPMDESHEFTAENDNGEWETVFDEAPESIAYAVRDIFSNPGWNRHRKDTRTARNRLEHLHENWSAVMDEMVTSYLRWKYPATTDQPTAFEPTNDPPAAFDPTNDPPTTNSPNILHNYVSDTIVVESVDIYTLSSTVEISRLGFKSTSGALVANGYLGASPFSPQLVISLRTLELFRCLRVRKPSFSVEAFARVICDVYMVPYRPRYRKVLDGAFNVFLEVLRRVETRVQVALKRDTPNWRVLNACPACCYELEDEPQLKIRRMIVMDGNNSLKRIRSIGNRKTADNRIFTGSDYYLSQEYVDKYANEVKRRRQPVDTQHTPHSTSQARNDIDDNSGSNDMDGDPTDGGLQSQRIAGCASNWKAASADENKKMWAIFEETGIFASCCQHGLILWIADMVTSGELAKYPLAITAKGLETLGNDVCLAYDIGCSFEGTILRSSLADSFQQQNWRCCVDAFHGYTHSYDCQLAYHPSGIEGMGLEDLATMERVFSSSNQLTSVICYASAFNRRVHIDLFFKQWDNEKYRNLGMMLRNNYRQALSIIDHDNSALDEALTSLQITSDDLEQWEQDQRVFFSTLGKEPPWDSYAVAYVELLIQYQDVVHRYGASSQDFLNAAPRDYHFTPPVTPISVPLSYSAEASATRTMEAEHRLLGERREDLLREIIQYEVKLNIAGRWHPGCPEYQSTLKYISMRKYHKALQNLQRLVIQRLFELHKLNISQTAYRVHSHIAKALQSRCKAIRRAVQVYNQAALDIDPPRPTLDWSLVSHYQFLEEFPLLSTSQTDKPWAQPAIREAMKLHRRVKRAHEEIECCNIQVQRLQTYIHDEKVVFDSVLTALRTSGDPIIGAVEDFVIRRGRVNGYINMCIQRIYALEGYTGNRAVGKARSGGLGIHECPIVNELQGSDDEEGEDMQDEMDREVGSVIDYLTNVAAVS